MESLSLNVFAYRAFVYLWVGRLFVTIATLAQSVTLGWQVYAVARLNHPVPEGSLLVGMIGLAQFVPLFALTLTAGETIDRFDRRKILLICSILECANALGLFLIALTPAPSLLSIFALASVFGALRAFSRPASTALGPMLVPRDVLPKAIAWNSLAVQGGMILGPWIGGLLCAVAPSYAYAAAAALFASGGAAVFFVSGNTTPVYKGGSRIELIKEGLAYVWSQKIVFGAISLDLFAVLLGGATALLPVYARDILHIGPDGFGLLRSGAAIGGGIGAFWLSRRPLQRRAGRWMFGAVFVYGCATLVFGLSRSVALSMMALIVLGAADVISVFVRQTLVQIVTPDAMRGRVSAVSTLFISASNELGEFESGSMARFIGPVGSAVFGGIGSIVVTGMWMKLFPSLRNADRLDNSNTL